MRRRWIILACGLPLYLGGLVVAQTVLLLLIAKPPGSDEWRGARAWLGDLVQGLGNPGLLAWMGMIALIIAVTQAVFLLPVLRRVPPAGSRPRSLGVSLFLGGTIAAAITCGLLFGLAELAASLATGRFAQSPWPGGADMLDQSWRTAGALLALMASWVFWSLLLLVFTRNLWADRVLGRLVGVLLGGTLIELLVVVPIDVMVRRRTNCYCNTGSFVALCFGALGVIWLTGPGVFLAVTSRRRRLWRAAYCPDCGQPKGPTPGERCPECGCRWSA